MKRLILAAVMFAFAIPVGAQGEIPPDGPYPVADAARHIVISYLELDPDQVAAFDILWEDHRIAEEPILQAIADVQTAIDDLFATGAPDPTELGLLVIERRNLGEALIDVHVVYVDGFELLLDDVQADRLHQLRVADRIQRFIPAFKGYELIRR
jgi:hypothetical protein